MRSAGMPEAARSASVISRNRLGPVGRLAGGRPTMTGSGMHRQNG
jgi:hypothetical protein